MPYGQYGFVDVTRAQRRMEFAELQKIPMHAGFAELDDMTAVSPQRFFGGIAEQALRGGVEGFNKTIGVYGDNTFASVVQYKLQAALPGPHLLAHVVKRFHHDIGFNSGIRGHTGQIELSPAFGLQRLGHFHNGTADDKLYDQKAK